MVVALDVPTSVALAACHSAIAVGPEQYLPDRGVEVTVVDDERCVRLMREFIAARPDLWNEDIGR